MYDLKTGIEYEIHGEYGPLIVIENGLGNSMYIWWKVIEALKGEVRFLVYHRKGYGNSRDYFSTRSVANIAYELNELLNSLSIDEKFYLIGFSFGGMIAQYYAQKYNERLLGLILLDSTSVDYNRLNDHRTPTLNKLFSEESLSAEWLKVSELPPETFIKEYPMEVTNTTDCPNDIFKSMQVFMHSQRLYKTIADEIQSYRISSRDIKKISTGVHMDLTIISRDPSKSIENFLKYGLPEDQVTIYESIASTLQKELCHLSHKTRHIVAEGSDHAIMEDRPSVVIEAIREMVNS